MKVTLDRNKCIGCGSCAAICPEVFANDGEKAKVIKASTTSSTAKEAEESCPVQAITIN